MEKIEIPIKFKGIDSWNRPVFKSLNEKYPNSYFGSVTTLFPDKTIAPHNTEKEIVAYFKEHLNELEYFGEYFDCEPNGGISSKVVFIIVEP